MQTERSGASSVAMWCADGEIWSLIGSDVVCRREVRDGQTKTVNVKSTSDIGAWKTVQPSSYLLISGSHETCQTLLVKDGFQSSHLSRAKQEDPIRLSDGVIGKILSQTTSKS